ncbi:MAG: hypothetical protein QOF49_1867 [Chloroflexota bacterium]|nr:hypothetical protein [Chloroflexota bacterium]
MMSTRRLWLFLAIALPVLASLAADLPSVDLAYHLRAGAEILATRTIPTVDTYTFTAAGEPWFDQNWAAQVILSLVHEVAGWSGLAVLRAALVGLTFGSVLAACRRGGADDRAAALLTIGAFVATSFTLALRPQLFGIALFGVLVLITTLRGTHPRLLWLAVPLIAVWANVHGSVALGIAWLVLAWIADVGRRATPRYRVLVVAVVAALAATANPAGLGLWRYAAGIATSSTITNRITEWQPPDLHSVEGLVFFGSALAVAAFLARRSRPAPWPVLLTLAAFFVVAALAVRGLAWWPIVAAVTVAGLLGDVATPARTLRTDPPLAQRVNLVLAAVLVLVGVALVPVWRPVDRGLGTPAGLVGVAAPGITARLREIATRDDRLFAPQPWGSWFEYAVPVAPVFVDSRIELFRPEIWDEYDVVVDGGDGWADILRSRGVTIVVAADRIGRVPLASRLERDAAWHAVYADADGTIFVRDR